MALRTQRREENNRGDKRRAEEHGGRERERGKLGKMAQEGGVCEDLEKQQVRNSMLFSELCFGLAK